MMTSSMTWSTRWERSSPRSVSAGAPGSPAGTGTGTGAAAGTGSAGATGVPSPTGARAWAERTPASVTADTTNEAASIAKACAGPASATRAPPRAGPASIAS